MSKKMLPIYIIKTLQKYSDANHKLYIQEIIEYIQANYNETFERKAISRCIQELQELDYDIVKDNGFYLGERVFDKSEITFLYDVIVSNRMLSKKQSKDLLEKLLVNESDAFHRGFTKIRHLYQDYEIENKEFFLNIELLNEAIEQNKQVAFDYYQYGFDKKLHKKREQKYVVNPYELIHANERYYLIGNYNKYDNLSNYRIDKIKNVEILEASRKVWEEPIEYSKYRMEHLYMFSGKSVKVKLRFQNHILDQIIDWFGINCNIYQENEETSILIVKVNENALYYWLKQYDEYVERIE